MEVLLEVGEVEVVVVAVQGVEFRRETGGQVEEEGEVVEVQSRVGQTLLNSSSPATREDIAAATAKAGSTIATVKRRTSLASQKGEQ